MELETARKLVAEERSRVQALLADLDVERSRDEDGGAETGDVADPAQPLEQLAVDDAVAAGLRDRLAALDRADRRIDDGTYGRSVRSGDVIPDARLEADPAAELTVEEAAIDEAAER